MIFFKWLQRFFLIFSSFRYYISWNRLSCQALSTYTLNIPYSSEIWPNETALLKIITSYNCWIWGHVVGAASQRVLSLYIFSLWASFDHSETNSDLHVHHSLVHLSQFSDCVIFPDQRLPYFSSPAIYTVSLDFFFSLKTPTPGFCFQCIAIIQQLSWKPPAPKDVPKSSHEVPTVIFSDLLVTFDWEDSDSWRCFVCVFASLSLLFFYVTHIYSPGFFCYTCFSRVSDILPLKDCNSLFGWVCLTPLHWWTSTSHQKTS